MRIEKKQLVKDIGSLIEDSSFVYLISYSGLKVKDFNDLRSGLDKDESTCHVFKNTLISKAAEQKGISALAEIKLSGDTALVSGKGDPGATAKSLSDFAKGHKTVTFKGGCIDGALVSGNEIVAIAKLPSREVLLSQLVGTLQAPMSSLVGVLNAKLSSIVYVLEAYKNTKQQ